jgi:hypothetical protein
MESSGRIEYLIIRAQVMNIAKDVISSGGISGPGTGLTGTALALILVVARQD